MIVVFIGNPVDDRELLTRLQAGNLSGDALARIAGVTRAAIWKRIQGLRAAGIEIEGRAGDGYRLMQTLDWLETEQILKEMPAAARSLLVSLEVAWSVDSTNAELLRRAPPDQGAAVLMAERQTQGRGRRGRSWASPLAAHLYLSLMRRFSGGLARLGGLSLVAGVASAEALHAIGFPEVGLKWPNDLFAQGRKLGGLLVEGRGEYAGPSQAVIGLGINVRMPPSHHAAIDQSWTDLTALQKNEPSRNPVAAAVLSRLLPALDLFDREGLEPFLPRYAALDILAGHPVRVTLDTEQVSGIAAGVAIDGALRVRVGQNERRFHAGEVSVRVQ
ncbi:MAG: bifunctional biotin--[acetyl-CoA-carboxylase] ligase/biotin operon repressor BirA [Xanthomonadaceae bacterium]|jgi:BirA family biotin operon repressor/biotin-[acetyl-CoA-carboxylase] ligase|nr:bifunctional biotin--[acetyl-CoA-carboxylase] ligase/biotin operon repressor BirA [Xanthomonadaceae bacterium]